MSGFLTTHVLDTARGQPAQALLIDLYRLDSDDRIHLRQLVSHEDGRTNEQILPASEFQTGTYELVFHIGDDLRTIGQSQPGSHKEPLFLDTIPLRFGLAEASHYHVPLLFSPFGYSTYRGS